MILTVKFRIVQYYTIVAEKSSDSNTVTICNVCLPKRKEIKNHPSSTSNCRSHLKRKYLKEFQEYIEEDAGISKTRRKMITAIKKGWA